MHNLQCDPLYASPPAWSPLRIPSSVIPYTLPLVYPVSFQTQTNTAKLKVYWKPIFHFIAVKVSLSYKGKIQRIREDREKL